RCRRAALVRTAEFQADPDLKRALAMLTLEKFAKMIAYLHRPAGQRGRTNERWRYFEKVRYKWRRRRTIVRFVVLALDRWQQRQATAHAAQPARRPARQKSKRPRHLVKPGP